MKRSDRKRTTLTPGAVDLPRARRTGAEVALEKRNKDDAATKKANTMRLAAVRVAEIERRNEGSSANALASKQPRKRPANGMSKDVSFLRLLIRLQATPAHLKSHTSDTNSFQVRWKQEEGERTTGGHSNQEERRAKVRTKSD